MQVALKSAPGSTDSLAQITSPWITAFALSPDATQVAVALGDDKVVILDLASGDRVSWFSVGIVTVGDIRFDKSVSSRIHTDVGTFEYQHDPGCSLPEPGSPTRQAAGQKQIGYGVSDDMSWITHDGLNLLWIPSEYRPERVSISGNAVAIVTQAGSTLMLSFAGHVSWQ